MAETPNAPGQRLALVAGDQISGYKILRVVLGGGWGRVYEAARENGDRFAFKTIRPDLAEEPTYRRRFEREQSALRQLRNHPNLRPAVDWNTAEKGLLWLAVPWIDGPTLHGLLEEGGPLSSERAARLIAQAAEGLYAVHDKFGYVHRDLHPGNMMVEEGDHLRVIDFGLAKPFDDPSGSPFLPEGGRWSSPEALQGRKLSPAADIYSLGLVLAYLVTGKQPQGNMPVLPPGTPIPPAIRSVITQATMKRPGKRFKNAHEMAASLHDASKSAESGETFVSSGSTVEQEPASKRRLALGYVALVALLVASAAFALALLFSSRENGSEESPISAGSISINAPASWSTVLPSKSDRRLGLRVAVTGGTTSALLGSMHRQQLPARTSGNRSFEVALPAGRALRMDDVNRFHAQRIFVFHIGKRYPVLVCRRVAGAEPKQLKGACSRLATTVELPQQSTPIALPGRHLRRQARVALHGYAAARRGAFGAIGVAETHDAVAEIATGVAKAASHAAAHVSVAQLAPLRRALDAASDAWGRAAKAALKGRGFHDAGEEVREAEKRIRKARIGLVLLGFRIGGNG